MQPLGKWHPNLYQQFPYILYFDTGDILRKGATAWTVYSKYNTSRNRYISTTIMTDKIPENWSPVHVIRTAEWIIKLPTECTYNTVGSTDHHRILGKFILKHERQVIGQYEIATDQLELLKEKLETNQLILYCGANGGLKDGIGTTGYNLYIGIEETPFIYGHAAELQTDSSASSTRQELLAQIVIEYWIGHLVKYLGISDKRLRVVVITDSAASISIVEGYSKSVGAKQFLQPEAEVGMELYKLRQQNWTITYETVKVNSHIDRLEAPNERFCDLNDSADQLATSARDKVTQGEMEAREPCMLPHSRITC